MDQNSPVPESLWRIDLLGITHAVRGERVLTHFRTTKARDLLAYLALCGHPIPREELALWFWPSLEDPEGGSEEEGKTLEEEEEERRQKRERRNANLRQALSWLAKTLNGSAGTSGPQVALLHLNPDDHTVALRPGGFTTDVAEFEALLAQAERASVPEAKRALLSQAVQLRRGEPFVGFECEALGYWVEAHRYRLETAYEAACAALTDLSPPNSVTTPLGLPKPTPPIGPRPAASLYAFPQSALPNRRERFLLRLSVFPGSFSAEAAVRVCPEPSAPALLTGLVQEGTVKADGTRFRLSPGLRASAWESLERAERDRLCSRLTRWAQSLVTAAGREQAPEAQASLLAERENVTASLAWCLGTEQARGKDVLIGVGLAGSLWRAWAHWETPEEGLAWIERALAVSRDAAPHEAWALYFAAGQLCLGTHRPEEARRYLKEALTEACDSEQTYLVAWALHALGIAAYHRGEWDTAGQAYADALEGFGGLPLGVAIVLLDQGDLRQHRGDLAGARTLYERSLEMRLASGNALGEADARYRLGALLTRLGEAEGARAHLDSSLAVREREEDRVGIGDCLELLGWLEAERGGYGLALFLLDRCLRQFEAPDKWPSRARALGTLGDVLARQGERAKAERCYQEGLDLWTGYGHERWAAMFEKRLQALRADTPMPPSKK